MATLLVPRQHGLCTGNGCRSATEIGRDLEQAVKLGRGTSHSRMQALQDRMILVQPAEQGWSVTLDGQQMSAFPTRSQHRKRVLAGKSETVSVDLRRTRDNHK